MERNFSSYENVTKNGNGIGEHVVKPEDIKLLQKRLFENLDYLTNFLEKFEIKYCLSAGTCLGAVREHDFIEWDDDLDIALLRSDYDRLFELWDKFGDKENFTLCRTTKNFCAGVPIGLFRNNNTTYIREFECHRKDVAHGVKIDIEPMDEICTHPFARIVQIAFGQLYALFLTQRVPRQCSKTMRIGANILLWIFRGKTLRNSIMKISKKQATKYNGTGCEMIAINGVDNIMYKKDLVSTSKQEFHGKIFRVPGRFHEYLEAKYRNYMSKPSIKDRTPKDTPIFYDLNTPFENYRGIKF